MSIYNADSQERITTDISNNVDHWTDNLDLYPATKIKITRNQYGIIYNRKLNYTFTYGGAFIFTPITTVETVVGNSVSFDAGKKNETNYNIGAGMGLKLTNTFIAGVDLIYTVNDYTNDTYTYNGVSAAKYSTEKYNYNSMALKAGAEKYLIADVFALRFGLSKELYYNDKKVTSYEGSTLVETDINQRSVGATTPSAGMYYKYNNKASVEYTITGFYITKHELTYKLWF